jgi:hypothetical protein
VSRAKQYLTVSNSLMKSLPAKAVGVEAGGVWIESEQLADEFAQDKNSFGKPNLRKAAPMKWGSTAIRFFLPFSEVSLLFGFDAA